MSPQTSSRPTTASRFIAWTVLGSSLLTAAAIGIVTARPASGQIPVPACAGDLDASRQMVREMENAGEAAIMQDLDGEEARTWIAALNAYPPQTDYPGDALMAVVTDGSDGVMVALFEDGCHILGGALPAEVYIAVSKAVEMVRPTT